MKTGSTPEHLNHFSLIISRCLCKLYRTRDNLWVVSLTTYDIAIYSTNSQKSLVTPIIGVVSDGNSLQFFKFSRAETEERSSFYLGKFQDGPQRIFIPTGPSHQYSTRDDCSNTPQTVFQIRAVCETLYAILLTAYANGVTAHHSRDKGENEKASKWRDAQLYACNSCREAEFAWLTKGGLVLNSREFARSAFDLLLKRYLLTYTYLPEVPAYIFYLF